MKSADIIILSWDRVEDTKLAIDSSLQQKGIDKTVIVVDQGSKPENVAELREFFDSKSGLKAVFNSKNLGVPGGRNLAANQGTSDYIVALDNDAEFIDEYQLQKAIEIMESDPDIGVLGFRILRFGTEEDDSSSWIYGSTIKNSSQKTFYTTNFVGAGHMIRRSVFEQVKGYDERLFFMHEERDFAERVINIGYKIVYSPEVIVGHKVTREARVAWEGKRWVLSMRNSFYLHVKYKMCLPRLIFYTFMQASRGIRAGLYTSTFVGIWKGLLMVSEALKARKEGVGLERTDEAKAYRLSCSGTRGMSVWQLIRWHWIKASAAPGKKLEREI